MARRDDREPGSPPRVVCAVGWQYREYLSEEQRSQRRGPQRGTRVGVAWGCIARRTGSPTRQPRWGPRMQPDFHHGLIDRQGELATERYLCVVPLAFGSSP